MVHDHNNRVRIAAAPEGHLTSKNVSEVNNTVKELCFAEEVFVLRISWRAETP